MAGGSGDDGDLRMLVSDFAGVGVHAASRLTRLDVAPYHWRHVSLVIHEASVEVGRFVGVWRYNVRAPAGEGIFQEMEHGEEFAMWHQDMVAKETVQ